MTTVAKRLEIIQKLEKGMTIDKLVMEYGLQKKTKNEQRRRTNNDIEKMWKFRKIQEI